MCIRDRDATTTANADELIERAKDRTSNNLLNFFIYPPFKRFFKKAITTSLKNGVNYCFPANKVKLPFK